MKILWVNSLAQNQIALNLSLYKKLHQPNSMNVHFGMFKTKVNTVIHDDLLEGTIGLPINLGDKYTIPTNIPYEIYYKGGDIHIGPVIGHIVTKYFENLNDKTLSSYLSRLTEYQSIKGLVFICTKDSIYPDQNLIKGYYYNPEGRKTGSTWQLGEFPLPNAIINRSFISQKKIKILQEKIGDRIFNTYWQNLNKWNIWKRLSKDKKLIKHLPYTEKYVDIKQLKMFLKKYNGAYFKPFSKCRGRGILNVSKIANEKKILVIDERKNRYYFEDYKNLDDFLNTKLSKPSIIQQAVPFRVEKKMVDFRVILQRDKDKEWSFKGSFAKISQPGSVITNRRSREKLIDGREALISIYNMSEEQAVKVEKKMIILTIRAIDIYEKKGMHIGDVAADIILDSSLHLWLLELQLNHGISKNLPPEVYTEIKVTPLRYAKALSGFIQLSR
ncbi:hypothetical protein Amet_3423 [Alkaliphilus metalliredigens QYMF]|uniref:ATP-grasp domain-containing protein n=1 Tax=Alkaliphilus metalliredigens (strain QYMF) TaxID=293826 RepID=A6TTN3_ALKMQ|nr:YheC/YheD family protein [Alkaliphilus metalliredigens]ABR49551.1 hypothetical protein Amet_3423 [Alkaliphilus metalliredigens QYMF]